MLSLVLDLKTRLVQCAEAWAAANGNAPLSRLGKRVAGDANFFERLAGGGGVNVLTLEKFARFLVDGANWPADEGGKPIAVPREAIELAHVTGVSLVACDDPGCPFSCAEDSLSAGKRAVASRERDAA